MNLTDAERILKATKDPLAPSGGTKYENRLKVREVARVFEPDPDGLREVLYVDDTGAALTAYLRGNELVSIGEGW